MTKWLDNRQEIEILYLAQRSQSHVEKIPILFLTEKTQQRNRQQTFNTSCILKHKKETPNSYTFYFNPINSGNKYKSR